MIRHLVKNGFIMCDTTLSFAFETQGMQHMSIPVPIDTMKDDNLKGMLCEESKEI